MPCHKSWSTGSLSQTILNFFYEEIKLNLGVMEFSIPIPAMQYQLRVVPKRSVRVEWSCFGTH